MKLIKHAIGVLAFATAPAVFAAIIDFNDVADGTIIDNEYSSAYGVTINGVNIERGGNNLAVAFDTNNSNSLDDDLESPFTNINNPALGVSNPGNVLIIHENPSSCNSLVCNQPDDEGAQPAGYFEINFLESVTLNSIDFFDVEAPENALVPFSGINLFDIGGVELSPGAFFTPDTGGDNKWDRLNFDVAGVSSVRIGFAGSGAIDNLNFTVPSISVTEPSSFILFLLGLVGLGFSRRNARI